MTNPLVLTTTVQTFELLTTLSGQTVPALPQQLAALVQQFGSTFVLRPGGVAGGDVYTDWPSLYAQFSKVQGPRWVWIDGSLGQPLIPAGTFNVDNAIFGTYGTGFPGFVGGTLTFESGAVFAFTTLVLTGNLTFQSASSTPCCQMIEGGTLFLDYDAEVNGSPSAPWANVPNGVTCACIVRNDSELGEGTNAAISVQPTGFLNVFAWSRAIIEANCISAPGATGLVCNVYLDDTAQSTFHFGPHIGSVLQSQATLVLYTATTPANWNPQPGVVSVALDQLVAPNLLQEANTVGLSGNLVNYSTVGTLTRTRSGWVSVSGVISGTDSTTEIVQITILMDGGVIGVPLRVPVGDGAGWGSGMTALIQMNDTAPHTFGVSAQGLSAGTLSVAIDRAQISIHELG